MDHHQTLERNSTFYDKLRHQFWYGKWMWVAAIALFLLSFGLWQWFGMNMKHIRTGREERLSLLLPDNSRVQLDPRTSLRYREHFNESAQRQVWLKGTAVFAVNQQEADIHHHPRYFIVHTDLLDITAAGARFSVKIDKGYIHVGMLSPGSIYINFKDKKLKDCAVAHNEALEYRKGGTPVVDAIGE
ncbi:FecR domain-containing protein [Chitinophaga agrisoli]|uniref:FecR domain-containing protein n=1 Tax=Chitinophaga agrisoli TaxID=2607653 RepID=A0A5B2VN51_9BACT|nr:FecR family protein [Chitinophaga agrisoli]KAA2240100.1 FecR domain-containing protein [Chitinophaga agrisoli]